MSISKLLYYYCLASGDTGTIFRGHDIKFRRNSFRVPGSTIEGDCPDPVEGRLGASVAKKPRPSCAVLFSTHLFHKAAGANPVSAPGFFRGKRGHDIEFRRNSFRVPGSPAQGKRGHDIEFRRNSFHVPGSPAAIPPSRAITRIAPAGISAAPGRRWYAYCCFQSIHKRAASIDRKRTRCYLPQAGT
jgi:hypothetical protein